MNSWLRLTIAALAIALTPALTPSLAPLRAQQPPAFKTRAEVVLVDFIVSDKSRSAGARLVGDHRTTGTPPNKGY